MADGDDGDVVGTGGLGEIGEGADHGGAADLGGGFECGVQRVDDQQPGQVDGSDGFLEERAPLGWSALGSLASRSSARSQAFRSSACSAAPRGQAEGGRDSSRFGPPERYSRNVAGLQKAGYTFRPF